MTSAAAWTEVDASCFNLKTVMAVRRRRCGTLCGSFVVGETFKGWFTPKRGGSMKLEFRQAVATFVTSPTYLFRRHGSIASPMAFSFQDMVEEARLSARALLDYGEHFFNPTVR